MGMGTPHQRLIEWTGERCVPWTPDIQVIYEHYHRYAFALRFTEGKRVLDLASGEGYGCALMAAKASSVVGLEIDPVTVEHARANYPLGNLSFEVGSITDPDALADAAPFDVITCFEAIEHVAEQDQLLELVRNRLAPSGVLLCSTPDVAVYTEDHGNENPFHVHELHEDEFHDLLSARFGNVVVLRQNVAVGSLIHDNASAGSVRETEAHSLRSRQGQDWAVEAGAPHTYLLAIASDKEIDAPTTSVLVDPDLTLVASAAERAGAEQRKETEQVRGELTTRLTEAAAREHELTDERDAALHRAHLTREEHRRVAAEADRLRRKNEHDDVRLNWLTGNLADLRRTVHELATENATLRAEHSAMAQRMIGRYRSTIERVAPRGTRRRNAYELALGRQAGVLPEAPAQPGPVAVTTSGEPIVSVVIPTYGNWAYTRRCLESIEVQLPTTPFEVIVVDDASVDDSADRVAGCAGVRLVRAPRNLGFVGACNLGAEHARGSLLMFLNNDTEVREGWLDKLVEVVEDHSDVGLVGAKLVYPDGRLQECGGIVWADGTGWNYGRGGFTHELRYQTLREVDYCSGAALLVRTDLFNRIGGFDTRYAPAYYEDTDLAFAVRAAGFRTMVQPASVVVHHEGVSNGTDVSSGVKRHQEINRSVFAEKWAPVLAKQLSEASPLNLWLARQRTSRGHHGGLVLVADHQVPRPDEDSGSIRMVRLLELLVELDQRVVFFPMNHAVPERYVAPLQKLGVTVVAGPAEQAEFLREAGAELRLTVLSRPQVAWQLLENIREHAPDSVVAYDTVDVHFLRLTRQADLAAQNGDTAAEATLRRRVEVLREMELGLVRTADLTFTVSDVERDLLGELVDSAHVEVLSNVHSPEGTQAVPDGRSGVLFVGSFDHIPNRDAALWLSREIMPLVRRRRPDAVAHIVGSNPPQEMLDLAGDGVVVHGWVDDLDAAYLSARVVVAPLRFGAGVKGKVGESLGHGVPVVGTDLAAEGMHLVPGRDILIGDTSEEIAEAILTLLDDDALWQRMSEDGKVAVLRRFGPDVARNTLSGVLARTRSH
ncbi:Glycosyltransferase, GT2 family [Amycolatopsis marina]|uniref:Glycosyltransferase, GT2 family n=1 Tax=Amycolatopsis marina TaxID=490629 RepID=A0A1I0W3P2_9PSEU|nr:glycosyltransferase [Amycolatopsis marina]SFA83221.1 Glycosyltransferase, GT2 family [Amycolatopsis marina]